MHKRYDSGTLFLGLILLGTEATLYFFSRVALFEIPIVTFTYCMILALSLNKDSSPPNTLQIISLITGTTILSVFLKPSTIIYMAPVLGAITLLLFFRLNFISYKKLPFVLIFLAVFLLTFMYLTYDVWGARIDFSPYWYAYGIIENPLLKISPFLVMAGLACASYVIAYQPNHYFLSTYRLSLLSLVVLGPLIFPLFSYHPVRYYVPYLPAYILLIIEWYHTAGKAPAHNTSAKSLRLLTSVLLVFLVVMYGMIGFELHEKIQIRMLILAGTVITVCAWIVNKRISSNIHVKVIINFLVLCTIVQNIYTIGLFLTNPSYKAEEIRTRLTSIIKEDEIVSGDWAPFLALGSPVKTLYANDLYNQPDSLKKIKPDYFILSETPIALQSFETLENDEDITIGAFTFLGIYNATKVYIYPLSYKNSLD